MNKNLRSRAIPFLVLLAALAATAPQARAVEAADSPYAYHLRLVRVSSAGTPAGAAVGLAADDGEPVLLPEYEAWGSPEQLDSLAVSLGAERADAITGFFLRADEEGIPRFERELFVGGEVVRLEFRAEPPGFSGEAHDVSLLLATNDPSDPPLTEAELRLRTERTVAVACPSIRDGEWLVAAVTLLEPRAVEAQERSLGKVHTFDEDGVEKPRLLHKVNPVYPETARRTKLQGEVLVQVMLDREGIPRAPMVVKMTPGCEELAASAVDAVLQWRYEPARLHGAPVPVYFTVTVQFRLS